jgi:hypothetical protein
MHDHQHACFAGGFLSFRWVYKFFLNDVRMLARVVCSVVGCGSGPVAEGRSIAEEVVAGGDGRGEATPGGADPRRRYPRDPGVAGCGGMHM